MRHPKTEKHTSKQHAEMRTNPEYYQIFQHPDGVEQPRIVRDDELDTRGNYRKVKK